LTFLGFMHGEAIGFGQTPTVAVSYLAVAAIFGVCAKFAVPSAVAPPQEATTPVFEHGAAVAGE
jgi:AGZA family xanthine/uracil permease-like MFS transporter